VDMGFFSLKPVYEKALGNLKTDSDPAVAGAAKALLAWDGKTAPDSAGPTIFHALNAYLLKTNMEDEVSAKTMEFMMAYFNMEPFVFEMLGDPANPAWDDRRTEAKEQADEVIAKTFRRVAADLSKEYGEKPEKWAWQKAAPFYLSHPFGTQKALSGYLNRGPFPTSGSGNTVFKNQFMRTEMTRFPIKYGPVLRVAIDLNDLPGSAMSIPGGQSGRPSSRHYDDILPLYMEGKGLSMEMDLAGVKKNAKGAIFLKPE
jgi:penicillin G amidase